MSGGYFAVTTTCFLPLRSGTSLPNKQVAKLRCLNAQKDLEVKIEVSLQGANDVWPYPLGFKGEGEGSNRIVITHESVCKNERESN